jgi:ferric-dicitrate binding protein FerR (iron transport regulator)
MTAERITRLVLPPARSRVEGGIIEDARVRQRRHQRAALVALVVAAVIGLIVGFSGGGHGGSNGASNGGHPGQAAPGLSHSSKIQTGVTP